MKRYFVRAIFSGWHEVNEEAYYRYIDTIRKHANAVKNKDEFIAKVTRIEVVQ